MVSVHVRAAQTGKIMKGEYVMLWAYQCNAVSAHVWVALGGRNMPSRRRCGGELVTQPSAKTIRSIPDILWVITIGKP